MACCRPACCRGAGSAGKPTIVALRCLRPCADRIDGRQAAKPGRAGFAACNKATEQAIAEFAPLKCVKYVRGLRVTALAERRMAPSRSLHRAGRRTTGTTCCRKFVPSTCARYDSSTTPAPVVPAPASPVQCMADHLSRQSRTSAQTSSLRLSARLSRLRIGRNEWSFGTKSISFNSVNIDSVKPSGPRSRCGPLSLTSIQQLRLLSRR